MKKKKRVILHGEVALIETDIIPDGAKPIKTKKTYHILAESETVGNDHRLELLDDTLLMEKDGVLYVRNPTPTKAYCKNKERHDDIVIPASIWIRKNAQEWDPIEQEKRNIAD